MGLSSEDVILAYRVVLNRTPSPAEVAGMVANYKDLNALRQMMLGSDEFAKKYATLLSERDARRRPTLVHLHIPNTGGATLAEALAYETHLMPNAVYHDHQLEELRAQPSHLRRGLRYIRGHLSMGAGEALRASYRYLVVIRRPGPRIYSFFRHIQRNVDHPAHEDIVQRNLSFGEYLEFSLDRIDHRRELDNGQLRRLAGRMEEDTFDAPQDHLRPALHGVLDPQTILGFTEHMKSLVHELYEKGFLSTEEIASQNVSPAGKPLEQALAEMTADQRRIYDDYTAWDNFFYELCMSVMPPAY